MFILIPLQARKLYHQEATAQKVGRNKTLEIFTEVGEDRNETFCKAYNKIIQT